MANAAGLLQIITTPEDRRETAKPLLKFEHEGDSFKVGISNEVIEKLRVKKHMPVFVYAVVGKTGAQKSTLCNALLHGLTGDGEQPVRRPQVFKTNNTSKPQTCGIDIEFIEHDGKIVVILDIEGTGDMREASRHRAYAATTAALLLCDTLVHKVRARIERDDVALLATSLQQSTELVKQKTATRYVVVQTGMAAEGADEITDNLRGYLTDARNIGDSDSITVIANAFPNASDVLALALSQFEERTVLPDENVRQHARELAPLVRQASAKNETVPAFVNVGVFIENLLAVATFLHGKTVAQLGQVDVVAQLNRNKLLLRQLEDNTKEGENLVQRAVDLVVLGCAANEILAVGAALMTAPLAVGVAVLAAGGAFAADRLGAVQLPQQLVDVAQFGTQVAIEASLPIRRSFRPLRKFASQAAASVYERTLGKRKSQAESVVDESRKHR